MHEVSLGGTIRDYLTGEQRDRTTYEDLRQALAKFLVEERGFAPEALRPRYAVTYEAAGATHARDVDIAVLLPRDTEPRPPGLFLVFCAGQVHTYLREVQALCRLALPAPCPLGVVTDMREAELFSVRDGSVLAHGLHALPGQAELSALAASLAVPAPGPEQREMEGRILHTYTGFLKTCCGEACSL